MGIERRGDGYIVYHSMLKGSLFNVHSSIVSDSLSAGILLPKQRVVVRARPNTHCLEFIVDTGYALHSLLVTTQSLRYVLPQLYIPSKTVWLINGGRCGRDTSS